MLKAKQLTTFADEDMSPLYKMLRPTLNISSASTDVSESESEVYQSSAEKKRERYIRSRDRIVFALHVINFIISSVLITRDAKYFAYWSAFYVTACIAHRTYDFYIQKWHMYMLDFCYFANWIVIFFVLILPQNELLFKSCFAFTMGVLMFSIGFFRNSLAFHNLEKMTSVSIHFYPGVTMFLIRWHDASKAFYSCATGTEEFGLNFLYKWYLAVGLLYGIWGVFYYLAVFVVLKNYVERNNFQTLFSYTILKPRIFKMVNIFGARWQGIMFMSIHLRLAIVMSTVAIAFYYFYWLGIVWMVTMHLVSISNGASYYLDFHSTRYEKQFHTHDDE